MRSCSRIKDGNVMLAVGEDKGKGYFEGLGTAGSVHIMPRNVR